MPDTGLWDCMELAVERHLQQAITVYQNLSGDALKKTGIIIGLTIINRRVFHFFIGNTRTFNFSLKGRVPREIVAQFIELQEQLLLTIRNSSGKAIPGNYNHRMNALVRLILGNEIVFYSLPA
jgi:hypothetical protein